MAGLSWIVELKELGSLAGSAAFSRLLDMLRRIIGMMLITHFVAASMPSVAVLNAASIFIYVTCFSMLYAVGVIAARLVGAGDKKAVGEIAHASLLVWFGVSVCAGILCWIMPGFLLMIGEPASRILPLRGYFHWLIIACFFSFLQVGCQQLLFALKRQGVVLRCNIASFFIYLVAAYLFIVGGFGMQPQSYAGLAQCYLVMTVFCCVYYLVELKHSRYLDYGFFTKPVIKMALVKQILRVGLPMTLQFTCEISIFFAFNMMINLLDVISISANQVVFQMASMVIVPMFGVSEAVGILVGHRVGAQELSRIVPVMKAAMAATLVVSVVTLLVFLFYHHALVTLFLPVSEQSAVLLELSAMLFLMSAINRFFDNWQMVTVGGLRGLLDTRFAMRLMIVFGFIKLFLGYVLVFKLGFSVAGFYYANGFGMLVCAFVLWRRWLKLSGTALEPTMVAACKFQL